jgi:hypothetical protein
VTYSGVNPSFIGCAVDANAGVIAIGNVILSGQSDVILTKISATGATVWTNRISLAGDQFPTKVLVDPGGDVYALYEDTSAGSPDTYIKKLRGTDGGTIWTFTLKTPVQEVPYAIHLDSAGQLYLVWLRSDGNDWTVGITIVNQISLASSLTQQIYIPAGMEILSSLARPAGGVYFALGTRNTTPGIAQGLSCTSTLNYVSASNLLGAPVAEGFASVFAVDKLEDKVYSGGIGLPTANSFTACWHTMTPFGGQQSASHRLNVTHPIYRGATFANGFLDIAGGFDTGSGVQPGWFFVYAYGLNMNCTFLVSPAANESANYIGSDNFGGLYATSDGSPLSAVFEMDLSSYTQVDTKTIPYRINAAYTSPFGAIGTAGAGGGVSLFKPRDLKDIYMGSNKMLSGSTANANIRVYEPYTAVRRITLFGSSCTMPAFKDIAIGATSVSAVVTAATVSVDTPALLFSSYGGITRTFNFTIQP